MVHIMVWVPVTLYLLMLAGVNSQTRTCVDRITFVPDKDLGPEKCSGHLGFGGIPICGNFDNDAARRACWDLDINSFGPRGRRGYSCRVEDGSNVNIVVRGQRRYLIEGGTIGESCFSGSPDCFLDCHANSWTENGRVVTVRGDNCDGNTKDAAIACDDRNECLEGVLRDCHGPFDKDCSRVTACASNADCTNNMGAYNCQCKDGYYGNAFLLNGCEDIDECTSGPNPCDADMCQNTPGSYVCLCRDGYSWDPEDNECEIDSCRALPNIDESNSPPGATTYGTTRTYNCIAGYEPSISTPGNSFTTTCRDDGTWCNCASFSCQKVKCGTPPTDGNAYTPMTSGVYNDQFTYTCLPGFLANGDSTYHLDCQQSGLWSGPPVARCKDENECLLTGTCPTHSMCYNTAGSYICICDPGYTSSGTDCTEISCGPIPDVLNGQRTTHSGAADGFFGMVVNYRCEDGYTASIGKSPHHVIKSFDIECKLDECWSPLPIPKCIPVSCGDPDTLPYATRHGTTFYYQDEVSYTCVDGFRPSDYSIAGSSTHKTFVITCDKNGDWSERPYCVDIDECLEIDSPCGPGDGHYCINKKGGYTCSCAPYFRLDNTGTTCIGIPANTKDIDKPCEFYHTLNFCTNGECHYDDGGLPRCRCNEGYVGAFCDIYDTSGFSPSVIMHMALAGFILSAFTLIMGIALACYMCCRNQNAVTPSVNSPPYAAPRTAPVIAPAYRKPRSSLLSLGPYYR